MGILRVCRFETRVLQMHSEAAHRGARVSALRFSVDLIIAFMLLYPVATILRANHPERPPQGEAAMATKTNYILKVSDAKLADIQKALKDANIAVVSIMEVHKEETA